MNSRLESSQNFKHNAINSSKDSEQTLDLLLWVREWLLRVFANADDFTIKMGLPVLSLHMCVLQAIKAIHMAHQSYGQITK